MVVSQDTSNLSMNLTLKHQDRLRLEDTLSSLLAGMDNSRVVGAKVLHSSSRTAMHQVVVGLKDPLHHKAVGGRIPRRTVAGAKGHLKAVTKAEVTAVTRRVMIP